MIALRNFVVFVRTECFVITFLCLIFYFFFTFPPFFTISVFYESPLVISCFFMLRNQPSNSSKKIGLLLNPMCFLFLYLVCKVIQYFFLNLYSDFKPFKSFIYIYCSVQNFIQIFWGRLKREKTKVFELATRF